MIDIAARQHRPHGGGKSAGLPAGGHRSEGQPDSSCQRRQIGRRLRTVPRQRRGSDHDSAGTAGDHDGDQRCGQYGGGSGVISDRPR